MREGLAICVYVAVAVNVDVSDHVNVDGPRGQVWHMRVSIEITRASSSMLLA
jgi:hypothetical protein